MQDAAQSSTTDNTGSSMQTTANATPRLDFNNLKRRWLTSASVTKTMTALWCDGRLNLSPPAPVCGDDSHGCCSSDCSTYSTATLPF